MKKATKSGGSKLTGKASTATVAKPAITAAMRREQLGRNTRGGDLARFAQPLKPKAIVPTASN
jgi:hypothetical protein